MRLAHFPPHPWVVFLSLLVFIDSLMTNDERCICYCRYCIDCGSVDLGVCIDWDYSIISWNGPALLYLSLILISCAHLVFKWLWDVSLEFISLASRLFIRLILWTCGTESLLLGNWNCKCSEEESMKWCSFSHCACVVSVCFLWLYSIFQSNSFVSELHSWKLKEKLL